MAKVLIVEDDEVIAQGMASYLASAGFDPVSVSHGEAGLARLRFEHPEVCVVDLMLPGMDGWRLIEQARAEGIGTPIIVVSARGTEHDRVHALEIGADDYLVKPFSMKELVARVTAASRRGTRGQEKNRGEAIEIEELRIDPRQVQAYIDGESAGLTPTEFRLLYASRWSEVASSAATSSSRSSGADARGIGTEPWTCSSASFATRSTAARRATHSSRRATASATSSNQSQSRSSKSLRVSLYAAERI